MNSALGSRILRRLIFTAKEVKKSLGADSKVLYPPIPSTFYNHKTDTNSQERETIVVTTARFGQGKGVELVPTIASLADKNINFVMIGLAHDQGVVDFVKRRVRELGLENRLRIITDASREEIKMYLGKAKVYLHTTRMEHFGISIAEAMAMGCIPVVHDSGGAPEFVPDKYRYRTEDEAAKIIENATVQWSEKESELMMQRADRFSETNFAKNFVQLFSEYIETRT